MTNMNDLKVRIRNMLMDYIGRTEKSLPSPDLLDCWLKTYADFLQVLPVSRTSRRPSQCPIKNSRLKRTLDKLNLLEELMQCQPIKRIQYDL